jgi:hypothetical protein
MRFSTVGTAAADAADGVLPLTRRQSDWFVCLRNLLFNADHPFQLSLHLCDTMGFRMLAYPKIN